MPSSFTSGEVRNARDPASSEFTAAVTVARVAEAAGKSPSAPVDVMPSASAGDPEIITATAAATAAPEHAVFKALPDIPPKNGVRAGDLVGWRNAFAGKLKLLVIGFCHDLWKDLYC